MPLARTTFTPWIETDMSDREFADLDMQGLIVHPIVPEVDGQVPAVAGLPRARSKGRTPQ